MSENKKMMVDTAAIMFSSLSSESWGRTFRYSAYFKNTVDAAALKEACRQLMPYYPSIYAYLEHGFFWNRLVLTDKLPEIVPEDERGMRPITMRGDKTPDFRLTYSDRRINIECSHSLGDGKGIIIYFKALLARYQELCNGDTGEYKTSEDPTVNTEDAFRVHYDKNGEKENGDEAKAFHFPEEYEEGYTKLLFAEMSTSHVKTLAHKYNMTITEYLTAALMLGIIRSNPTPVTEPITVAVPVNLRRFFPTLSVRNFTVQTFITFKPDGRRDITLEEILDATRGQLRAQIKPSELIKKVNKYGALVSNPVINIVPNIIKQPVMRKMQRDTHAGVTTIFTNYGACSLPEVLHSQVEKLQFVNGDTRSYGLAVTCSCIGWEDTLSLCFSRANKDTVWYDACIDVLSQQGLQITTDVIEGYWK